MNKTLNFRQLLINEIGLEGLDGITLQTLWIRIADVTKTKLPFPERLQAEYWNILCKIPDFQFFELLEPRPDYIPYDRFSHYDVNDLESTYIEPAEVPDDIYKHCLVNDLPNGIMGSCPNYYKRINITTEARTTAYNTAIDKWGNKLVIVASQQCRELILYGLQAPNNIELTPVQYCILERIGRSRFQGEITQGKRSLQVVGEDPKSLFYHRKTLLKHKLITKQVYYQKTRTQNYSGSLLHLQRYYVEKKSKYFILTEKAVEFLRTKPNYRSEYSEISIQLNLTQSTKKLFKSSEFQRFIHTDVRVPYRELYPNSSVAEWKHKYSDKERLLRVVELINPDIDVSEHWNRSDELDEDEEESGFKNYEDLVYGIPWLAQAAAIVRQYGENGCCQTELGEEMGLGRLNARSLCRNLIRRNVVTCFMNDVGRQRVTRFVSRRFDHKGQMTVQFKHEREKMISNIAAKKLETEKDLEESYDENSIQSFSGNTPFKFVSVSPNISNENNLDENNDISNSTTHTLVESNPIEETVNSTADNMEQSSVTQQKQTLRIKEECIINETVSRKRPLENDLDCAGPSNKVPKTEDAIDEEDVKKNIDKIYVKIVVPKMDNKVKGFSQGFSEQIKDVCSSKRLGRSKMTYRLLRRANFIIECIRQHKVIADLTKLIKMIQEDENDEGYMAKIDKKSLIRLLLRLAKDGHVKYMKATLSSGQKEKTICFVSDPKIDENHSIILSALEQAKMKFFIQPARPNPPPVEEEPDDLSSPNKPKLKTNYDFDGKLARKQGFCPKFVRMRLIHEILFYMVYDEQDEPIASHDELRQWLIKMNQPVDEKLIKEMSPIYNTRELSWKTFMSPIPSHVGWPKGWTLICDILLRLPLKIFVQCFSITYHIEGLEDYLKDPVRKFFLMKNIPLEIRNALMYKRRYIFQMHEIINRLCYVGLTQFGPQKLKEKDQVFVFLNRKTSMLNTITSTPHYHEITPMEYEKHEYFFDNYYDVEQYWYDLWSTCMNTRLGGRLCVTGKYVVLEQLHTKQAMLDAVFPRLPEEAPQRDCGAVPGNCRGAAGLDSALFAHLKRNWSWHGNNEFFHHPPKPPNSKRNRAITTIKITDPKNPKDFLEVALRKQTITGPINRKLNKPLPKADAKNKKFTIQQKTIVRKVLPKTMPRKKRPLYDEIDEQALKKMAKLRTDWSPIEDHVLLLCTIASNYLCTNRHKHVVSVTVIRDVLHKLVQSSHSKTSRACQRRIAYIMKNINTRRSVNMCMEEIRQSKTITDKYKDLCKRILNEQVPELELNIAFIDLVSQMSAMFSNLMKMEKRKASIIPSTVKKFREVYRVCEEFKKTSSRYTEPDSTYDINFSVIKTVIHSSMCCTKDKSSWAYQLFKVYQQYPEALLRSVITKTRHEQLISLKKSYMNKKRINTCMPLSSSPYKLSITYKNHLISKFSYGMYEQAYEILTKTAEWINTSNSGENVNSEGLEVINPGSGTAIAVMELTENTEVKFNFEIPEEIIVLDQKLQNDKTYERIIERYYSFLRDPSSVNKWVENPSSKTASDDEDNFPNFEADDQSEKKITENVVNVSRPVRTRIAFYMMRAEICEGLDDKSTQHMHDFFVVNACRVFIKVPSLFSPEIIKPEALCEGYLNIKENVCSQLLWEIRDSAAIPNDCVSEEEIVEKLSVSDANEHDIYLAKAIIKCALLRDVLGATAEDVKSLVPEPYEGKLSVVEILDILTSLKIIIQTGIVRIRFIHYEHKRPWIINSYKILRLEKEKMQPVTPVLKSELKEHLLKHKKNFSYLELQKSKQRLDLKTQQEIKVLIFPWIRIDGTLNRRVLDRWLGTILIACIEQPGITLQVLSNKFYFLKPVDTLYLIKYLTKLTCVKPFVMQRQKITLFSKVPPLISVPASGLEDPAEIIIEPTCDAVSKLAIFIGKKAYTADFLHVPS